MTVNYNPRIITDGLEVYVDAGNIKSYISSVPGTWNDLSGKNYNVTLTNMDATNYSSSGGGHLIFDGSNEVGNIVSTYSSFSDYNQQITIEAWVNIPLGADLNDKAIIYRDGSNDTDYGLRTNASGNVQAYFGTTIASITTTSNSTNPSLLVRDRWYQLTAVWSGTSALYVDGVLVATNSQSLSGNTDNTSTMKIALRGGNVYTNIRISSTKIYNRALTASEIQQNFNALRGRFSI